MTFMHCMQKLLTKCLVLDSVSKKIHRSCSDLTYNPHSEHTHIMISDMSTPLTAPTAYVTPLLFPVSLLFFTLPATYRSALGRVHAASATRPQTHSAACSPPCIDLHLKRLPSQCEVDIVLNVIRVGERRGPSDVPSPLKIPSASSLHVQTDGADELRGQRKERQKERNG